MLKTSVLIGKLLSGGALLITVGQAYIASRAIDSMLVYI